MNTLLHLLGGDLIERGLADYSAGQIATSACLISIAWSRLKRGGLAMPTHPLKIADPEHTLYDLLMAEGGDAYSRYNALLRRLISFEQALECHQARSMTAKPC